MSDFREKDPKTYPEMVKWFDPISLFRVIKQKIISEIFGSYADKRTAHAALDEIRIVTDEINNASSDNNRKKNYFDLSSSVNESGIWIDYVADLGDGFDSTYSVAYSLAQEELQITSNLSLPKGNILLMGGDECYPAASLENYKERLEFPYRMAFPVSTDYANKTPLFLLPGNHDWYDGLDLFLAKFCKGESTDGKPIPFAKRGGESSGWFLPQRRSYYSIKLPYNCWIFGLDSQLGGNIDRPQEEYFFNIIKSNRTEEIVKIIFCIPAPSWLYLKSKDEKIAKDFSRVIDHIATKLIKKSCNDYWPNFQVVAVLTGDLHHYSRYAGMNSGTEFITSGGGGAFLHPTHLLPTDIEINCKNSWLGKAESLSLKKGPSINNESLYPSRKKSEELIPNPCDFLSNNLKFCFFVLGITYSIIAMMLSFCADSSRSNLFTQIISGPVIYILLIFRTTVTNFYDLILCSDGIDHLELGISF